MRRTDDLWVRDEIGQQMRMLETASFFNPQSQGPYELLLRIDVRSGWQFTPSGSSGFWLLMKRSELWDNYVERFGFSSAQLGNLGPETAAESIAQFYVNSAFALVDLASMGNKEERGFPRDMSGHLAKKWLAGFTTELVTRVLKTIDEPTTKSQARRILLE